MAYTVPPGNAADFVTPTVAFPPPYNALHVKQSAASYTAPIGNAIAAQFPAPSDWPIPLASAVNFTVVGDSTWVANGVATVNFIAAGLAEYHAPAGISSGTAVLTCTAAGVAQHGVNAHGTANATFSTTGLAAHGVAADGTAVLTFTASASATVLRYEVTGEVRIGEVLLDRTVRLYSRTTGQLLGEQITTAGRFKINAGPTQDECYLLPLDLSSGADDWTPPCANRVIPVLASDA